MTKRNLLRAATCIMPRALIPCVYFSYAISAGGCSGTQAIADASQAVRANAESSRGRFVWISDHPFDTAGVQVQAAEGVKEQTAIIAASESIVRALPGVKDSTPYWASLLSWGLIVLAIMGAIALLWMTGIGSFMRQLLASVAGLIPRRQRREADLAVKVMDETTPEGIREYIAARRASDPVFDAAYSRAARERYGRMPHPTPATISPTEKTDDHDR